MTVEEGSIPVGDTGKNLDTTIVTTSEGDVHREAVFLADPENPDARAAVVGGKEDREEYGPDVDRANAAKLDEVQEAIDVLSNATLPEFFEDAQEIVEKRALAFDLMKDDTSLVAVMTAYYAYRRWKREDDDMVAILLLM